jgi:hypothetical protein
MFGKEFESGMYFLKYEIAVCLGILIALWTLCLWAAESFYSRLIQLLKHLP